MLLHPSSHVPSVGARKGALLVLLALIMVMSGPVTARGASSTAGDATPNFTESSTCAAYGLRGPQSTSGSIGSRIYGPFADFFGRSSSQVASSTVWWAHPNGKSFKVHTRNLAAFQGAGQAIVQSGTGYKATTGAAQVWRNISGSRQMSHHAVGNAIDVNPPQNPYTSVNLVTNMPPTYVEAWRSAGFCWGGDWRFSKDAMHYTWRGPASQAGEIPRDTPYAPLTAAAAFKQKVLDVPIALPPTADLYAMSDRRRDGADDLYALVPGSTWQMRITGAVSDFGVLGARWTTAAIPGGVPLLADSNGDGRADLWRFNTTGVITADIFSDQDRFRTVQRTVTSGATWSAGIELGLAVFDADDWLPDLYVIDRGSGLIKVYSSSSGYKTLVHTSSLPVAVGNDKIVLADRGNPTDGTADVWLVGSGPSSPVRIVRFSSSSGYSGSVESIATGMNVSGVNSILPGDYDGDGRIDLYQVANGRLLVWLGGVPDRSVSRLDDWFKPSSVMTFDAGPVCAGECDSIGYVDGSGSWRLAHEVAWAPEETNFFYGVPNDEPFMGDWDCDGVDTPGLYRRTDGYVYLRNSNNAGFGDISYFFGIPGDIPLAGDFDGDGCDTVSIYRPSEARFYIINELGSGDGGLGAADFSFLFGDHGDKPFAGDFDGDDIDTIGLH
ncbi:MAG: M15 family metallopeptidase, partial [Acidimicrobiia bacterium]